MELDWANILPAIMDFNPGWIGGISGVGALTVSIFTTRRTRNVAIDAIRLSTSNNIRSLLEKFRSDEIKAALDRIDKTPAVIRRLGVDFADKSDLISPAESAAGSKKQNNSVPIPARDLTELSKLYARVTDCVRDVAEALPNHHRKRERVAEKEAWKKDSKPLALEINSAISELFETRWELHKVGLLSRLGLMETSAWEGSLIEYLRQISKYIPEGSPSLELASGNLIENESEKFDRKATLRN